MRLLNCPATKSRNKRENPEEKANPAQKLPTLKDSPCGKGLSTTRNKNEARRTVGVDKSIFALNYSNVPNPSSTKSKTKRHRIAFRI